jgi:Lon protease-like protein
MFPLGSVLYPQALLPLQVFEPRYLLLLRDCLAADAEFGVVLIERGLEVGGGDQRFDVGTVARIVSVERPDRGPIQVLAVGTDRVRVSAWLPDDPYPRAALEAFPDEVEEFTTTVSEVEAALRRVLVLASELGADMGRLLEVTLSDDPSSASYQAAALAPIGPLDSQRVLETASPAARLRLLEALLAEQSELLQARLAGA